MSLSRIKLFGKLLGNGRSTTGIHLSKQTALYDCSTKGKEVDARVVVESHVLGGDKCLDDIWRQIVVIHTHTILLVVVPRTHNLAVGREYLGGKSVDRVL